MRYFVDTSLISDVEILACFARRLQRSHYLPFAEGVPENLQGMSGQVNSESARPSVVTLSLQLILFVFSAHILKIHEIFSY